MANFFRNSDDLDFWVKDQESLEESLNKIMKAIKVYSEIDYQEDELDVKESCTSIYKDDSEASRVLYQILSKHNLTNKV